MNTVKETTLHPDGNDGIDLYPKTNINQVQELPQKLLDINNSKLSKPETPTADSAITMLADGTVGTKPLSEIGGGGKLYSHKVNITFTDTFSSVNVDILSKSSEFVSEIEVKKYLRGTALGSFSNAEGAGSVTIFYDEDSNMFSVQGAVLNIQDTLLIQDLSFHKQI
mgnify:CR=1 FL=1